MFQIIYSKKAIKFLKMQGTDGYRLRVGSFRVLFDVHGIIVDIVKIDNRGQIYKGV